MFKPQFVPLIQSGSKRTTLRPIPKRRPEAGDVIDIREWASLPYRSKQLKIRTAPIVIVRDAVIWDDGLVLDGLMLGSEAMLDAIAKADGFDGWEQMYDWFKRSYSLPFHGILICWDPDRACQWRQVPDGEECGQMATHCHSESTLRYCDRHAAAFSGTIKLELLA